MPHRTFLAFIFPSLAAMLLFIALPLLSIAYQSLYIQHPKILADMQVCDPFGCMVESEINTEAMDATNATAPAGRFNGLGTYVNQAHLATTEMRRIWRHAPTVRIALAQTLTLPFYRALAFTLAYTIVVTPLSIVLGFLIALAADALPRAWIGAISYITMLPMIVPSLLGALVLFWMIDSRGVIGAVLRTVLQDPGLSLKTSPTLSWITLFVYGIWTSAPYVFIVLYAGLQTVPRDTLESAMIDGASRWARLRHVVGPHLRSLVTLLIVVGIMDNFRVFESIIGLSATANASSLSILIFTDLMTNEAPLFGSAAATSMLTILGIAILMLPAIVRSWKDFRQKA